MTPGVLIRYLLGQAAAIKAVAASRAAFPTGIALVFITTIPRNYDQTFILEAPGKWLFGNLAFSLVSGTWLYLVAYACTARLKTRNEAGQRPGFWSAWPAFMGLFWFTAPIAWLYAIPVERFLGELDAAKANLTLLGLVSVWRVALMIRVLCVVTGARIYAVTLWVLTSAFAETFLVTFFSGFFARSIMAGMAGMRYSPAERVLMDAVGTVFVASLFGFPIALLGSAIVSRFSKATLTPFPEAASAKIPLHWLIATLVGWIVIALPAQHQTRRSAKLERLVRESKYADAVNYMASHRPADFAPTRQLPPKPFDFEVFEQLPGLISAVKTNHPVWVRQHFVVRMEQFTSHFRPWSKNESTNVMKWSTRIDSMRYFAATNHVPLILNLASYPEGLQWIVTNRTYIPAVEYCEEVDYTPVRRLLEQATRSK